MDVIVGLVVLLTAPWWLEVVGRPVVRALRRRGERRAARRARDLPVGPPIERISADLRRLEAHLRALECSDQPMKAARMRATLLAYDDVLLTACRALDVDAPQERPLAPVQRLRTEAELARAGLSW